MAEDTKPAEKRTVQSCTVSNDARPSSEEERRVWEVLEQARQNVKAVVKRELEGELVTGDLVNFRMR